MIKGNTFIMLVVLLRAKDASIALPNGSFVSKTKLIVTFSLIYRDLELAFFLAIGHFLKNLKNNAFFRKMF